MPSFWKILCFPKKRLQAQDNVQRPRDRENTDEESESVSKRKNLNGYKSTDDNSSMINGQRHQIEVPVQGSCQRLIEEDSRPNKRRRVQDIWSLPPSKEINETSSYYSSLPRPGQNVNVKTYSVYGDDRVYGSNLINSSQIAKHRAHKDFGSGYTPNMNKSYSRNVHSDTMYGYVPKAVQNVYASKALEGVQIDDFFNRLHRESSMTHFATKPAPGVRKPVAEHTPILNSLQEHDKVSLIQSDQNGDSDSMETEELNNFANRVPLPRRTENSVNLDFFLNDTGEVLY